jgi:hypothetical protein
MSEHIFQISGLPRSGTAWIATVLSLSPDVTCYHESLMQGDPETLLRNAPTKYAGDCSTYGFMPRMIIPSASKVFINRPIAECVECATKSFQRAQDEQTWKNMVRSVADFLQNWKLGFVPFESLFQESTVNQIVDYCCPGATIDPIKLKLALSMNIQRSNPAETFSAEVCNRYKEAIWG